MEDTQMEIFDLEEFKKGKFVVHCDTKEKAEKFLKYLASKGLEWSNGDSLIGHNWSSLTSHTNWEIYKDETCYSAENGIEYCNKDYFEKHIYDIKSVDDFLFPFDTADLKEFPIEEFKKGHLTVICDTKEKAEKFLKYLDSQGLKWANDKKATECSYFDKENKMCYTYVDYDWIKGITFGTYVEMLRYQKECDLQFVSSDDYLFPIDDCDSVQDEDNTTETNDTGIVDFVTFNSYTSEGNYEIQLETSDKECYETVGKIIQLYVDKHNSSDKK